MLGSGYMGDGNTEKTDETMRQIRKWRQTGTTTRLEGQMTG